MRQSPQGATPSGPGPAAGSGTAIDSRLPADTRGKTGSKPAPISAVERIEEPPALAATPSKIVIGVDGMRAPAAKTLVLWADLPSRAIEVTAQPDWLHVTPRRQGKKGQRRYEITVYAEGLPAGRVHDGSLNIRSPRGSLTIPVVVERESTR